MTETSSSRFHLKESYDVLGRVVVLGDRRVGKSAFLQRLQGMTPEESPECCSVLVHTTGLKERVLLNVSEVSGLGQSGTRVVETSTYRDIDAALFLFDVTDEASLAHLLDWAKEVFFHERPSGPRSQFLKVLVATKTDLAAQRVVPQARAAEFADHNGMLYHEVSSRDGSNVDACLRTVAEYV